MQRPCGLKHMRLGGLMLLSGLMLSRGFVHAQTVITGSGPGGRVNIFNTDLAVLEAGETRKDLACTVTPAKPTLGFDLRFHGGYEVTIPLKDLSGEAENALNILFRVERQDHRDQPVYFAQHIRVPPIEESAKGDAYLQGGFDLGEGDYHVDWLMRDRSERVCSFYWDSQAVIPVKDRPMGLAISPGAIQRADVEQFKEEPPVERSSGAPLNVKVLVNFAPQNSLSPALQPLDTTALVSILRSIVREPRIGKFSVIAFNMQEQKVVYRQQDADRIDFPALGEAVNKLNLGTIDLRRLGERHGDTEFLADLVRREVGSSHKEHPDAFIFAGPKVLLDSNLPQETLKEAGDVDFPVFYMNYNLNPQAVPWKDAISHTVHFFRGYEYTITKPRDLWVAVSEMVSRIVKSRNGRQTSAISGQ